METKVPVKSSEITPESVYMNRRQLLQLMGFGAISTVLPAVQAADLQALSFAKSKYGVDLSLTERSSITSYNNFYEFGLDKSDPQKNAGSLKTKPWKLVVEGLVEKPGTYDLDELLKHLALEERIYRMRCVEAWSMVIPWVGFPLARLIQRFQPLSSAKYLAFETLHDPKQMPGQRPGFLGFNSLDWPYVEGLRMDEAMHPLTIMAVGLYGRVLPNQNGAPLRLVVPWKYGFKGIKSIVKIRFMETQPATSWNRSAPQEYGFYANVNPVVDHPRWSQARERRIVSSSLFGTERIDTLPFNGYADEVAHLYKGMDLRKHY